MKDHDEVRAAVAQTYAKAVTRPAASSCCSTSDSECEAMKLSGYTREDLEALPADAVVNSFGCGNPLAFSGVQEGDTVLDLGSGAGIDLFIAAKKVGPAGRVIGIDMTDEMIARARENIAASEFDNIEVRKGIIEKLPVNDASVDWVISNCVINLSPDKPAVFREIARVLKPGGRMSVSDIVVQELPDWARQSAALYSSCVAGAISEEEYLGGLRKAGLEDVKVQGRHVYDAGQLKPFIKFEPPGAAAR
jgi:arsenite methyltransferase